MESFSKSFPLLSRSARAFGLKWGEIGRFMLSLSVVVQKDVVLGTWDSPENVYRISLDKIFTLLVFRSAFFHQASVVSRHCPSPHNFTKKNGTFHNQNSSFLCQNRPQPSREGKQILRLADSIGGKKGGTHSALPDDFFRWADSKGKLNCVCLLHGQHCLGRPTLINMQNCRCPRGMQFDCWHTCQKKIPKTPFYFSLLEVGIVREISRECEFWNNKDPGTAIISWAQPRDFFP